MEISSSEEQLIDKLLFYNHKKFTHQLELIDEEPGEFSEKDLVSLLNLAEKISRKAYDDQHLAQSLYICGLITENFGGRWDAVDNFITEVFIKLGLNPTAKMVGWNTQTNKFNSLGNIISELYATSLIDSHEVRIQNTDVDYVLSNFQKRIWDAIGEEKFIGLSAPTSAGKSFALVRKLIDSLERESGHVIYIVPTLSLISQVVDDFRETISNLGLDGYFITQNLFNKSFFDKDKVIYVATQERILTALLNSGYPFDQLKTVVIDEIQNLERLTDEQDNDRPKILYDVIDEIYNRSGQTKFIFSGPLLNNLKEVLNIFFPEDQSIEITEHLPTVINTTYSFREKSEDGKLDFIQSIPYGNQQKIEIEDEFELKDKVLDRTNYGGKDKTHDFMSHLLHRLEDDGGNIIFSKSTPQSVDTAISLANHMKVGNNVSNIDMIGSLIEYIEETVHPYYELGKILRKGVAYHHGKVPNHIRYSIERAYKKGYFKTIVCTTTLMQGVNLPAKNLIIRNPDLGQSESISPYEFANLRGRTGRMMKDLVGRAIVIDDMAFKDEGIGLEDYEGKELNVTYEDRFNENSDEIIEDLLGNKLLERNKELITYIRQTILRLGDDADQRLLNVGIELNDEEISEIKSHMDSLSAPYDFLVENRYWDPLDLELMYRLQSNNRFATLPQTPFDRLFYNSLEQILEEMIRQFPYYSDRYLNSKSTYYKYVQSLVLSSQNWAKGMPLKDVIDRPPNWSIESSEDVDDRIKKLYSTVKYGIPKFLSPLIQLQDKENPILSLIEHGAFSKEIRFLIQMGLPRECAIRFNRNYTLDFIDDSENADMDQLYSILEDALDENELSRWDKYELMKLLPS